MSKKLPKATMLPLLLAAASARGLEATPPARPVVSLESVQPPLLDEVGAMATSAVAAERREVGPYRVLRELGSGGMGTVYLAEAREPSRRRVALKLIREESFSSELAEQFELERRALAAVDHDFVARLYESGSTEGRPWMAMEYVAGEPITKYCDRLRLDVEARLALFVEVCAAVQHLHERGVLHRDLKPANILVTERDGRPVPKLIDLGLARLHDQEAGGTGRVSGTPAYMAPEQFGLSASKLDERSDVYALGIVLRELLIGTRLEGAQQGGVIGAALRSMYGDNPPPSAQLSGLAAPTSVARRRSTPVARLRRRLKGALDRIASRAVEPLREERYTSASALAEDLEKDMRRHALWRSSLRGSLFAGAMIATGFACGLLAAGLG